MNRNVLLILLLFPLVLSAKERRTFEYERFRVGIETGVGFLEGSTVALDNVRENQSFYYNEFYLGDDFYSGYVDNHYTIPHYYVGIKPEFSITNSLSIAAGIRCLGSNSTLNSDRNYFLWKVAEDDLTTHYARVKEVKQNSIYLGIPVEMLIYTYKRERPVRHYFRWGVNFNFLFWSATTPYFETEAMNKYANKVKNDLNKLNNSVMPSFTSAAFIGTGLKIGRMNRPFGTIEIRVPIGINSSFSSFVNSSVGFEFQAAVYIPLEGKKLICVYN